MKCLLIDTSNQPLSVAVMQDDNVLSEINSNIKQNHSTQLMPAIQQVIGESQIAKEDIDAIIVAQGPGSYTGLRIGVTVAKTLAYALNAELYGVSSLKALAATVQDDKRLIVPIFDARREAVYTGIYEYKANNLVKVKEDQYLPIQTLLDLLHRMGKPYVFVGIDTEKLKDLLDSEGIPNLPKAKYMKKLIETTADIHQFKPNYIKLPEAERNWLNQQNKN
ncbi:tRNA (adenosine(37)-N6)-threonylcarbamoyltransferase complex dimerization subunit type 1 TsaB [Staphylococcus nepalensis]|uniref:tRNA (Adenosine(37)-N6)-threonylcarbamoyltransferase complex dimerization subunit type 1 TsaB n=1 Tax=Staphylococcus nepalensis TaxID=214473 RepID=A0ABS3L2Y7_9STAP|nr:tRNA (adenosine(37)-N6)-threonylcarbamoyltransferase complex dimerization subunit type 1 TsaB [Staphylococcus nepalensis]MBO1213014.1 tRNA (adenosine(37)-N6)-threonylcarbamoyltransferase complex dimerization subunit type 1 TsaB [Staphylococcus nepalensis]MBO1217118.1 tRNA (adenosine(37)-N6)-threonylcarbamoyltransferase complex dimerization subunit type 1 TsaB [Staphylococcus nepalensis]MBO1227934.1 tRNA (adenosine(37)-N6)-threonylcarbamoyltransferase complex dimerization subunit type 1 TsaB [